MSGKPRVIDLEGYLAERGAGRQCYGDVALHRSSERISEASWQRLVEAQRVKDAILTEQRRGLTEVYHELVAAGTLRPPTARERWEAAASGDPDRSDVQAAKRILAKIDALEKLRATVQADPEPA